MHSEHKRVTKPHGMEHGKVLRHGAGVQIFEWGQGRCGKGTAAGQAGVFAFASLHLFLTTEQFVINHHGLWVLDEPSSNPLCRERAEHGLFAGCIFVYEYSSHRIGMYSRPRQGRIGNWHLQAGSIVCGLFL